MNAGGMPPIDLPPDDLKALIAYVENLKYRMRRRLPGLAFMSERGCERSN
jgi:hypothetical protein